MFLPDPVVRLAARLHGLLPRHRIVPRYMTPGSFDGLARRGRLRRRQRGVYVVAGSPAFPEQEALAAQLRARPRARVTGPFALGLLGVDGFSVRDPFAVLTAPGRRLRDVDFAHWTDPLPDGLHRRRGPVRACEPGLALCHTAGLLGPGASRRIRTAFEDLRSRELLDAGRMHALAGALPRGEPGLAELRDLLADGTFAC